MQNPCIEYRYLGGTENVDFEEFAMKVVQDHDLALEVAETMLRTGEPYKWNEDQAEFYAEFEVTNAGALHAQLYGEDLPGGPVAEESEGQEDDAREIKRLRSAAARALERVGVGDFGEAEMILSQVVNLDGSPVESTPDERWFPDAPVSAYFSTLRRRIDAAIVAADAGFKSETDPLEPPDSWSEAAREFDQAARTLRSLRAALELGRPDGPERRT